MLDLDVTATRLSDREMALKREVRGFLETTDFPGKGRTALGLGGAADKAFSAELGRRGWVGMQLPEEFGGRSGTAVDRLVVTEELLAAGAPVGYHWVADRQSGPSIAVHGTRRQKEELLPLIARGELCFAIGMSEPEAGSDLASVATRAERIDDANWRINGSKIWTSNAALATHILGLFRTSDDKHGGLTQFIVTTDSPGIEIRPVPFLDGTTHFYEVFFTDVVVPDAMRLGGVGSGWGQNRSELALERGGVDRWFSMIGIVNTWAALVGTGLSERSAERLHRVSALAWACRGLSLSIARAVDAGGQPVNEAALIKDYATQFEQLCLDEMHDELFGDRWSDPEFDTLRRTMTRALQLSPSWTIRGGTNQILKRIVGKAIVAR